MLYNPTFLKQWMNEITPTGNSAELKAMRIKSETI